MRLRTLVCIECGTAAAGVARGWVGHLVDGDDEGAAEEVVFFCPCCASREFGRHERAETPREHD